MPCLFIVKSHLSVAAKRKRNKSSSAPACVTCSNSRAGLMGFALQAFDKIPSHPNELFHFQKKIVLYRFFSVRAFKLLKSLFHRCFLTYPLLCWATHCMSTVIVEGIIGSGMLLKLNKSKKNAKDFCESGKEYKMEDPISVVKEKCRTETYMSLWSA